MTAATERLGVVSGRPAGKTGQRRLIMSDGTSALVEPDLTHEQIAERYQLDRVVTMPAIDFCAGVHLDGPLAGQTGYATNELGSRTQFYLQPQPGGPTGYYEVTSLATPGKPADMRFVGFTSPEDELPHPE